MSEQSEKPSNPNPSSNPLFARFFFLLVVAGCGAGAYFYFLKDKPGVGETGSRADEETGKTPTVIGKRYRIFVNSIIVPPTDEDGDKWDGGGKDGAPDVFFRIYYKDNMIYESSTIDDVLVAEFAAVKAGIGDILQSKNASEYLEAANVAHEDESSGFMIKVIDSDAFDNDTIGKVKVLLKDLQEGSNKVENNGLVFQITVVDADADINSTLKALKAIK